MSSWTKHVKKAEKDAEEQKVYLLVELKVKGVMEDDEGFGTEPEARPMDMADALDLSGEFTRDLDAAIEEAAYDAMTTNSRIVDMTVAASTLGLLKTRPRTKVY